MLTRRDIFTRVVVPAALVAMAPGWLAELLARLQPRKAQIVVPHGSWRSAVLDPAPCLTEEMLNHAMLRLYMNPGCPLGTVYAPFYGEPLKNCWLDRKKVLTPAATPAKLL